MATYYFDCREDGGTTPDEYGADCATLEAAELLAQRIVGEIARDLPVDARGSKVSIEIRDQLRHRVSTITMSLQVSRQPPLVILREGQIADDREVAEEEVAPDN